MIRAEDIPDNVTASLTLALWIVLARTEAGKVPSVEDVRMLAANVLNAKENESK